MKNARKLPEKSLPGKYMPTLDMHADRRIQTLTSSQTDADAKNGSSKIRKATQTSAKQSANNLTLSKPRFQSPFAKPYL